MPNQYCPNKECTYYGGSGLIVAMQPESFRDCPKCGTALSLVRPPPLEGGPEASGEEDVLPSFIHFKPALERSYSDVERHLALIDSRPKRAIPSKPPKRRARQFKNPRQCVMDEILDHDAVTVSKAVPYHEAIRDGVLFLRDKMKFKSTSPSGSSRSSWQT